MVTASLPGKRTCIGKEGEKGGLMRLSEHRVKACIEQAEARKKVREELFVGFLNLTMDFDSPCPFKNIYVCI